MRIFLDDIRFPADCRLYLNEKAYLDPQWIIVRNFEEFVSLIEKELDNIELISFDHDLGTEHYRDAYSTETPYDEYEEKTGYHCAKFLVEFCMDNQKRLPSFLVHSMNPVGKRNIVSLLTNFKNFQENGN